MVARAHNTNGKRQSPEQTPDPGASHALKMLARLLGRIAAREAVPMRTDASVSGVSNFNEARQTPAKERIDD